MAFIKRHQKAILILLAVCVLAGAGGLYWLKTSTSAFAVGFRDRAGEYINSLGLPRRPDVTRGLAVTGTTVYVDGELADAPGKIRGHDVKTVYATADGNVFCDYAAGFSVKLPADMTADLTKSPKYITFKSPSATAVISREWAYEEDVSAYIGYYFHRFLLDESYRAANHLTLLEDTKTDNWERLTVRLDGAAGLDTYTYLTIKTGSRFFFRVMVKYSSENAAAADVADGVLADFRYFRPEGTAKYTTDFRPELPANWSAETRALYDRIAASPDVLWGIFTSRIEEQGIREWIPAIEKSLEFQFPIVLAYVGVDRGFPTEFMERCDGEGRIVELTLQITETNNLSIAGHSPWLDLYRTGGDERIRAFARGAKAFGKPFLFRLNNEMNSDWTSYSGVTNLLDPELYAENWRTVYRIFEEEGVDNAIWIFNPNDRDAPPNAWNSAAAYYPGNEYVQLFGVTGYNNGDYYRDVTGEYWREFDVIYDKITRDAAGMYDAFPWIITEFSSSSVGGDKAKWIDGMFKNLPNYPRIKAAVWFSSADYDVADDTIAARPYWIDETDETLAAFRKGLLSQQAKP
ncbi:MAG: glycoside hydrolase family 26 protein [Oscillospiraceae bacterium]|jgi:hypothetical protein|nr:glycoside hydrolase family 26 protein [Oscillospiraceae bacterium]